MEDQTQRALWGEDVTGKDEMSQTESRVSGYWVVGQEGVNEKELRTEWPVKWGVKNADHLDQEDGGGGGMLDAAEGTVG